MTFSYQTSNTDWFHLADKAQTLHKSRENVREHVAKHFVYFCSNPNKSHFNTKDTSSVIAFLVFRIFFFLFASTNHRLEIDSVFGFGSSLLLAAVIAL